MRRLPSLRSEGNDVQNSGPVTHLLRPTRVGDVWDHGALDVLGVPTVALVVPNGVVQQMIPLVCLSVSDPVDRERDLEDLNRFAP